MMVHSWCRKKPLAERIPHPICPLGYSRHDTLLSAHYTGNRHFKHAQNFNISV